MKIHFYPALHIDNKFHHTFEKLENTTIYILAYENSHENVSRHSCTMRVARFH